MENDVKDKFGNKSLSLTMYTMMAMGGHADMYDITNFSDQEIRDHNYYNMYTWTQEQEEEFAEWMFNKLSETLYRKEMCRYPSLIKTKKIRKQFVSDFISNHGLKTKRYEA